jgi:cell division protein FtsI/penicillin-binding protein 2
MQDGLNLKELLIQGLDLGEVSEYDMIHILVEQGIVSADHDYVDDIDNRKISVLSFIIDKMDEKEITPQMLGLDPSTGSVIITKVNTGEVLAAVSYPSYDSNELVNTINASYFSRLMNDTTTPMINRVFMERRAPGSSFKMITAMTALDKGVITPLSTIKDEIVFTKAGLPYTRSWSTRSQGVLNVSSALEVSSNYFFAESAYRLGNQKNNNKLDSINAMNEFMIKFGLNDRSGVEIGEAYDFVQDEGVLNISSPELMRQKEDREWFDGDTVKTAIGQSLNSYTPANMVKYIATLASKGYRYALRLVDKTESPDGFIDVHQAKLEEELDFNASYLSAIEKGMLRVVEGSRGTARAFFNDFPYRIAAKTGTAQENLKRNDHTIFTGYFPVEDPQIAIYVLIPFGDTKTTSAPAAMVAERILYEYVGLNNTSQTKPNYNSLLE